MKKKIDLLNDTDRLLPPGMTNSQMIRVFFFNLFLILTRILVDGNQLTYAIERANYGIEQGYHLESPLTFYELYPPFHEIVKFTMLLFGIMALMQLSFAITNYLYFHRESKSIYVMKRLKSSWTLWGYCFALPLIGVGIVLMLAVVYYICFCAAYFYFAPEGVIPEQTIAFFWRYVP